MNPAFVVCVAVKGVAVNPVRVFPASLVNVPSTQALPSVVVVPDLHKEVNQETQKEEDLGTARRLRAIIGIRDRKWHVVELLGLEDAKKKEQVPINDQIQFVIKGGNGLEDGDKVKLEAEED